MCTRRSVSDETEVEDSMNKICDGKLFEDADGFKCKYVPLGTDFLKDDEFPCSKQCGGILHTFSVFNTRIDGIEMFRPM